MTTEHQNYICSVCRTFYHMDDGFMVREEPTDDDVRFRVCPDCQPYMDNMRRRLAATEAR
jgi:hypothetical protein